MEGGGEAQKIWTEFNDLNRYLLESQEWLDAQAIANPARLQEFQREFQTILLNVEAGELALLKKYNHSIVAAWMVASKMEGPSLSHQTCPSVYAPFTPSKSG